MTIEEKIFNRAIIDNQKLLSYGFTKSEQQYTFEKKFLNDEFKAIIIITSDGKISGNVYDLESNDIYYPLRVENMVAGFVGQVREGYQQILEDIKKNCCQETFFSYPQANRITEQILKTYGDAPDFPWEETYAYGVFRNPDNKKWYALIMSIDFSKIDKKKEGEITIINLKLDEAEIISLLKAPGFYPAYHMNKNNWLTITLDDTLKDNEIMSLIDKSHAFTLLKKSTLKLK